MKIAASIIVAGILIAVGMYAGLTDGRRTYMTGCIAMAKEMKQSIEFAEMNCAFRYKP